MNITMDGEWAYACDPTTRVRILCVDRPGDYPVVVMGPDGMLTGHQAALAEVAEGHALVPLQKPRKPVEAWAVVDDGDRHYFRTKDHAENWIKAYGGSRLVRLIEAPEDAQ